jgi:hypothetical protein
MLVKQSIGVGDESDDENEGQFCENSFVIKMIPIVQQPKICFKMSIRPPTMYNNFIIGYQQRSVKALIERRT